MTIHLSLALISLLMFVSPLSPQQPQGECKPKITHENPNQIDPRPVTIAVISGIAQDKEQVGIPNVCLGLFLGHRLISTAVTDQKGRFTFGQVNPGRYRLVARYEGFCTANLPVLVKPNARHKRLVLHMQLSTIDSCSYGDYK